MRILIDLHHEGLLRSLKLLFETRLGHELYIPTGREWFEEGYWKLAEPYNNHPSTISQYLETKWEGYRAITLPEFKDTKFDIVIASTYDHVRVYGELVSKYQPQAKLVHQMGNDWPVDFDLVKNLMSSTAPFPIPPGVNAVFYHQEFDTQMFSYQYPEKTKIARSFVNTMREDTIFGQDLKDFIELERYLRYKCEMRGASCRDGVVKEQSEIARLMQESEWGVHLKAGGDGFGHIIHNWAAVGRPVIFRGSQYRGKLAGRLLKHMETGLDLDLMTHYDLANFIRSMSEGEHRAMCERMYAIFTQEVNFDKEEETIKSFLSNML